MSSLSFDPSVFDASSKEGSPAGTENPLLKKDAKDIGGKRFFDTESFDPTVFEEQPSELKTIIDITKPPETVQEYQDRAHAQGIYTELDENPRLPFTIFMGTPRFPKTEEAESEQSEEPKRPWAHRLFNWMYDDVVAKEGETFLDWDLVPQENGPPILTQSWRVNMGEKPVTEADLLKKEGLFRYTLGQAKDEGEGLFDWSPKSSSRVKRLLASYTIGLGNAIGGGVVGSYKSWVGYEQPLPNRDDTWGQIGYGAGMTTAFLADFIAMKKALPYKTQGTIAKYIMAGGARERVAIAATEAFMMGSGGVFHNAAHLGSAEELGETFLSNAAVGLVFSAVGQKYATERVKRLVAGILALETLGSVERGDIAWYNDSRTTAEKTRDILFDIIFLVRNRPAGVNELVADKYLAEVLSRARDKDFSAKLDAAREAAMRKEHEVLAKEGKADPDIEKWPVWKSAQESAEVFKQQLDALEKFRKSDAAKELLKKQLLEEQRAGEARDEEIRAKEFDEALDASIQALVESGDTGDVKALTKAAKEVEKAQSKARAKRARKDAKAKAKAEEKPAEKEEVSTEQNDEQPATADEGEQLGNIRAAELRRTIPENITNGRTNGKGLTIVVQDMARAGELLESDIETLRQIYVEEQAATQELKAVDLEAAFERAQMSQGFREAADELEFLRSVRETRDTIAEDIAEQKAEAQKGEPEELVKVNAQGETVHARKLENGDIVNKKGEAFGSKAATTATLKVLGKDTHEAVQREDGKWVIREKAKAPEAPTGEEIGTEARVDPESLVRKMNKSERGEEDAWDKGPSEEELAEIERELQSETESPEEGRKAEAVEPIDDLAGPADERLEHTTETTEKASNKLRQPEAMTAERDAYYNSPRGKKQLTQINGDGILANVRKLINDVNKWLDSGDGDIQATLASLRDFATNVSQLRRFFTTSEFGEFEKLVSSAHKWAAKQAEPKGTTLSFFGMGYDPFRSRAVQDLEGRVGKRPKLDSLIALIKRVSGTKELTKENIADLEAKKDAEGRIDIEDVKAVLEANRPMLVRSSLSSKEVRESILQLTEESLAVKKAGNDAAFYRLAHKKNVLDEQDMYRNYSPIPMGAEDSYRVTLYDLPEGTPYSTQLTHWTNPLIQTNNFGHVRSFDLWRSGEPRIRVLDEIQSDRANAAYAGEKEPNELYTYPVSDYLTENWASILLKGEIDAAVSEGLDGVVWTKGITQNIRWGESFDFEKLERYRDLLSGDELVRITQPGIAHKPVMNLAGDSKTIMLVRKAFEENADKVKPGSLGEGSTELENVIVDVSNKAKAKRRAYDEIMVKTAKKIAAEYGMEYSEGNLPEVELNYSAREYPVHKLMFTPKTRDALNKKGFTLYMGVDPSEAASKAASAIKNLREKAAKEKEPDFKALGNRLMAKMVDETRKAKLSLEDLGEAGARAIDRFIVHRGASAEAASVLKEMDNTVYTGLSYRQRESLDNLMFMQRVAALAYKENVKHPGGISSEDAQTYVDQFEIVEKLSPEEGKTLRHRANMYFDFMKAELKNLHEKGFVSDEMYEGLKDISYQRRESVRDTIDPIIFIRVGKDRIPLEVRSSGIDTLRRGATTETLEVDSRLLAAEVILRTRARIKKNEANLALKQIAIDKPDNDLVSVGETKTVEGKEVTKGPKGWVELGIWENGKKGTIYLEPEFAASWIVREADVSQALVKAAKWTLGTPLLKAFATGNNLGFAIANLPRDMAHMWLSSQVRTKDGGWVSTYSPLLPIAAGELAADYGTVFRDALFRGPRWQKALKAGLGMEFMVHQGKLFRSQYGLLPGRGAALKLSELQDTLGYLNETSEIAGRLAILERAMKQIGKREGITRDQIYSDPKYNDLYVEAVRYAREYLDFSQGGAWSRAADSMIPYFGATIQATRGVARSWQRDPKTFSYKVGQITALAASLNLANRYVNPAVWNSIDADTKKNYWIITLPQEMANVLGYKNERGEDLPAYFAIPKDQSQRWFAALADYSFGKFYNDKDIDENYLASALADAAPLPQSMVPPSIRAALALGTGKDVRGLTDIRDIYQGVGPVDLGMEYKQRFGDDPGTSEFFKAAGEYANLPPDRLKTSLEAYFTSNNIWTQLMGAGVDSAIRVGQGKEVLVPNTVQEAMARNAVTNRFLRVADKSRAMLSGHQENLQAVNTESQKYYRSFDAAMDEFLYRNGGDKALDDVMKVLEDAGKEPRIFDELLERYEFMIKTKDLKHAKFWLRVANHPVAARARTFVDEYNQATTDQEKQELIEESAIIFSPDSEFWDEVGRVSAEQSK